MIKGKPFPKDTYPWALIILRWIISGLIFALGFYIFNNFNQMAAIIYSIYAVLGIVVILPLSKCRNCYWYGKRCQIGWGKVAYFLFPKGKEEDFHLSLHFTLLLTPIWVLPSLLALLKLFTQRNLHWLIIFALIFILPFMKRWTRKGLACRRCLHRRLCNG